MLVCVFSLSVVTLCQPGPYAVLQGFPLHTIALYVHIACGEVLRTESNVQPSADDDVLCQSPSQQPWCVDVLLFLNSWWLVDVELVLVFPLVAWLFFQ